MRYQDKSRICVWFSIPSWHYHFKLQLGVCLIKDQSALEEEAKDPDRYNAINFKQPKKLPRTLDELDKDPDFQLLLDVPTFKVILG